MKTTMPKMTTGGRLWRGNPLAVGAIAMSGREIRRREKAEARRAAKKRAKAAADFGLGDVVMDAGGRGVSS